MNKSHVPVRSSIGFKLLRTIFGIYIIITTVITSVHIATEYKRVKDEVKEGFALHNNVLGQTLTHEVWHLDLEQLDYTLSGIMQLPYVVGVSVHTPEGMILGRKGVVSINEKNKPIYYQNKSVMQEIYKVDFSGDLFWHSFELFDSELSGSESLGFVYIYASPVMVASKVKSVFIPIIGIEVIKVLALWLIFLYFGRQILSRPLENMVSFIHRLPFITQQDNNQVLKGKNELEILESALFSMSNSLNETITTLQESEERFRTLVQNIRSSIVVHAADTNIIQSNAMAQKLMGLTEDQMTGRTAIDPRWRFLREDGNDMPIEEYPVNQVIASGKLLEDFVLGIYRPESDDVVWALLNAVPEINEKGDIARVIVSFIDITARKQAERALYAEKDKLQKYLDITAVIVVIIDLDQKVTLINKKGCDILGYREEEIVGKNWFDNFLPERYRDEVKNVFSELILGKVKITEYYENYILTKNGEERMIAWYNTVLRDDKGNITASLSSGGDITERKLIEEELEKHREHLEEMVKDRTKELEEQTKDLESYNRLFAEREFRVKELKDKIKELEGDKSNK